MPRTPYVDPTAAHELARHLRTVIAAFGDGPDSEDFWSDCADAAACDCVNPDHPHTVKAIQESVLRAARAALSDFERVNGAA